MRRIVPHLVACAAILATAQVWCAEKSAAADSAGGEMPGERTTLAEFISNLGDRSLKFVILPLDIISPARGLDKTAESGNLPPETEDRGAAQSEEADQLLLKKETAQPFIPATMVEGELTTKLDVAREIYRLRKETPRRARSSRAPSDTLLAVLKESHAERERLLDEGAGSEPTMIASRSVGDLNLKPVPQKRAVEEKKTVDPEAEDKEPRPFLLLAMFDHGGGRGESKSETKDAAKPGKEAVNGPKFAFLFANNPNRARTSRPTEPEAKKTEEKPSDEPIAK